MGAAFSVPLGNDQVLFFKTFGYLVLREFFTAQELETIHREFDYKLEEQTRASPMTAADATGRRSSMKTRPSSPACSKTSAS